MIAPSTARTVWTPGRRGRAIRRCTTPAQSSFHGPTVPVLQSRYHLKVVPYAVRDEATMQRVIGLGVDGLISDDPDLLVAVAIRAGPR